jgi:hypothetical protein
MQSLSQKVTLVVPPPPSPQSLNSKPLVATNH